MAENLEVLFQGYSKLSREERLQRLKSMSHLSDSDLEVIEGKIPLDLELAEHFVENLVGIFPLPLGIATYFQVDGRDIPIPMAIEETSVIAACSGTAKWIRSHGGTITTKTIGNTIIGQIQFPNVKASDNAVEILRNKEAQMVELANSVVPGLVKRGGGVTHTVVRRIQTETGEMLVLHVHMNPCDAMGANLINQVCEALKPYVQEWTGEKVGLCILSNLVDSKLTHAEIRIPGIDMTVGKGIESASRFAESDPYRATTHNKGVMNGIDPVLIATGNDWRAVEAGVHAYCARSGRYEPATKWRMQNDTLVGIFEAPLVVGTVGGVTKLHPTAQACLRILGVKHADELSRIMAAVGLVQNLGALRALSTVGIVKGHMSLHATNLAIAAGAKPSEMGHLRDHLVAMLKREKNITMTRARELLDAIRGAHQG